MHPPDETIVALATPPGRGGIAIVRLSGPNALEVAGRVFRMRANARTTPGLAVLGWIRAMEDGRRLDRGYLTFHPAGRSYTGDEVVELSCHGSPVLVEQVLAELVAAGARPAAPGEFTYRAVLNGRIDLAQAEGIRDLIGASTAAAARSALAQARGDLSRRVASMSETLTEIIAGLEAAVEFAEEPDVAGRQQRLAPRLQDLDEAVRRFVATYRRGRMLRQGARVVLAGRPNAGKSSLFNALLRHERAIVSPEPGTTRDFITERIDMEGIPVTLVDTAGLRQGARGVEAAGVDRARGLLEGADLILVLCPCDEEPDAEDAGFLRLEAGRALSVATKADLLDGRRPPGWAGGRLRTSAVTGEGLERLRAAMFEALAAAPGLTHEEILVGDARHHEALTGCSAALSRAAQAIAGGASDEIVLAELYAARSHLGAITGAVVPDDIYEKIFSTFCIGK